MCRCVTFVVSRFGLGGTHHGRHFIFQLAIQSTRFHLVSRYHVLNVVTPRGVAHCTLYCFPLWAAHFRPHFSFTSLLFFVPLSVSLSVLYPTSLSPPLHLFGPSVPLFQSLFRSFSSLLWFAFAWWSLFGPLFPCSVACSVFLSLGSLPFSLPVSLPFMGPPFAPFFPSLSLVQSLCGSFFPPSTSFGIFIGSLFGFLFGPLFGPILCRSLFRFRFQPVVWFLYTPPLPLFGPFRPSFCPWINPPFSVPLFRSLNGFFCGSIFPYSIVVPYNQ